MDTIKKYRAVLIISAVTLLFIIIPIISYFALGNKTDFSKQTGNKTVIIDNQTKYSSGVHPQTFASIGTSTYVSIALNIDTPEVYYHGVIRDDSFQKKDGRMSFILDIPNAKMSWQIAQHIDNEGIGQTDALITCVDEDSLIYPALESCIDRSTGGALTDPTKTKFIDIAKSLPLSGPSFYITYANSPGTDGDALSITTYTPTGGQDALNALISLGYDPNNYKIIYVNRSE